MRRACKGFVLRLVRAPALAAVLIAVICAGAELFSPVGATAAGVMQPVVRSVTASALPASGGRATVRAKVSHAGKCRLVLLSHRPPVVVYSHAFRSCAGGHFTARVVVAPNPGRARRAVTFDFVAVKGLVSARHRFSILLAARPSTRVNTTTTGPTTTTSAAGPAPSTTTTTASPTTTTASPTTTTTLASTTTTTSGPLPDPPVEPLSSFNWSGYALTGGPYTSVSGTFTVPALSSTAACDQDVGEWAGIDGVSDSYLVQAGVDESGLDPYTGTCTPGQDYIFAWWEVLPALPTPVSLPSGVHAGDRVTVAIGQVAVGTWQISLEDDTTGQSFSTDQQYNGPATSAEWVVESPGDPNTACGEDGNDGEGSCPMAPYASAVDWSGLSAGGASTTAEVKEVFCLQPPAPWGSTPLAELPASGATVVSSPTTVAGLASLLGPGFSTSYQSASSNGRLYRPAASELHDVASPVRVGAWAGGRAGVGKVSTATEVPPGRS